MEEVRREATRSCPLPPALPPSFFSSLSPMAYNKGRVWWHRTSLGKVCGVFGNKGIGKNTM